MTIEARIHIEKPVKRIRSEFSETQDVVKQAEGSDTPPSPI